jgi:hypothetical protein
MPETISAGSVPSGTDLMEPSGRVSDNTLVGYSTGGLLLAQQEISHHLRAYAKAIL